MNTKLWDSVCETERKNTKEVAIGSYKYTAIDAYSQIKKATELWGSFGSNWGVKSETYTVVNDTQIIYTAILFYKDEKECWIPIHSDIEIVFSSGTRKGKYNDNWTKKVATDALTKGLSMLGFNADVFLGTFDDSKHDLETVDSVKKQIWEIIKVFDTDSKDIAIEEVDNAKTIQDYILIREKYRSQK